MDSVTVNSRDVITFASIAIPAIILLKLHAKSVVKGWLIPAANFFTKQFSNRWKALLTTLALASMYSGALTLLTGNAPYELTTTYTTFFDDISIPIEQKDNVDQIVREKIGPDATDVELGAAGYNKEDNSISYQINYTLPDKRSYPNYYVAGSIIFSAAFLIVLMLPTGTSKNSYF